MPVGHIASHGPKHATKQFLLPVAIWAQRALLFIGAKQEPCPKVGVEEEVKEIRERRSQTEEVVHKRRRQGFSVIPKSLSLGLLCFPMLSNVAWVLFLGQATLCLDTG